MDIRSVLDVAKGKHGHHCPYCFQRSDSRALLKAHLRAKHPDKGRRGR